MAKAVAHRRPRYFAKKGRHKKSMTVSLAVLGGLAPTAAFAYEGFKIGGDQGGVVEAAHRVTMRLTGWEWKGGGWSAAEFGKGWTPILVGAFAHKLANKLGINRMIAGAGIPVIRI